MDSLVHDCGNFWWYQAINLTKVDLSSKGFGPIHLSNFTRYQSVNKRPVGLYSPLTAGIMTDFVIMIL